MKSSSASGASDATAAPPPLRRRWWRVLAAFVTAIALSIAAGVTWLGSQSALDFAIRQLQVRLGDRLVIEGASGALTSTLRAHRIRYSTPDLTVTADDVAVTWSPMELWSNRLRIDGLGAQRVTIEITSKNAATGMPESLALPVDIAIAHTGIAHLELRNGATTRAFDGIAFAYAGGPSAHALSEVALASDAGRIKGEITLAATAPFAARGAFALAGAGPLARVTANVEVGGSLAALDVKAALRFGDTTAAASATIAPLTPAPVRALAVEARGVDLATLDPSWPRTSLDLVIEAAARSDGATAGRLSATNADPGLLGTSRVPVTALSTRFSFAGDVVELSALYADFGAAGRASGSGRIAFGATTESDWRLALRDVDLKRLYPSLVTTRLSGGVRAVVAGATQRYEGEIAQNGMLLAFDATVAGPEVEIKRFRAQAGGGELVGTGSYDGASQKRFAMKAVGSHFDPSRFGAFPAASLDGTVTATGALAPTWSADVAIAFAPTAKLVNAPLAGTLRASLDAQSIRDAAVDLRLAGATLKAQGSLGRSGDRLEFTLDAPTIADLAPLVGNRAPAALAGRLRAKGYVAGTFADPGFGIDAHGEALALGALSFGRLDARGELAAGSLALGDRPLSLDATAARFVTPAGAYASASVRIDGTLARHIATLKLAGEDLDATATLDGSATGAGAARAWAGTLAAFENRGRYAARLAAPARLEFTRGRATLDDARFAIAEGTLRIDALAWNEGRMSSRGAFAAVPLATLARLAGAALPLRSTVILGGEWNVTATPRLNGTVTVRRERGDLYAGTSGALDAGEVAFGLDAADFAATFSDGALDARLAIDASRLGTARGTLTLGRGADADSGPLAGTAPLRATLKAEIASLAPLQPLLGTGGLIDGRVTLDLAAAGTRQLAPVTGTLVATGLRLDAAQYGLHWEDGRIAARIADDVVTLDEFTFKAGEGRFVASGILPPLRRAFTADIRALESGTRITWRADKFRATNRPDMRFVVTGNGTLGVENGHLALDGSLRVDTGQYEFSDTRGTTLSDDVIVKGRPRPAEPQRFSRVPLAVNLDLDLGNTLTVRGEGLEADLAGRVRVTAAPGGALTGKGTIRAMNGSYFAFGQRLSIDRGQLIFDGPIDNPALDIVALRKNLAVEAGVEVTGTVKVPIVRLTSDPPVPDGEKLSWLVLGQGLDRTSGADAAALQAAAASLFGQGRAPIGTTFARSIGIDDISLRGAASSASGTATGGVGGQVVAVGKRLSDKLYLVYEQGLTVANNALKIEYALSRNITLRAEAGVVSGFGIYYRRSFE